MAKRWKMSRSKARKNWKKGGRPHTTSSLSLERGGRIR